MPLHQLLPGAAAGAMHDSDELTVPHQLIITDVMAEPQTQFPAADEDRVRSRWQVRNELCDYVTQKQLVH